MNQLLQQIEFRQPEWLARFRIFRTRSKTARIEIVLQTKEAEALNAAVNGGSADKIKAVWKSICEQERNEELKSVLKELSQADVEVDALRADCSRPVEVWISEQKALMHPALETKVIEVSENARDNKGQILYLKAERAQSNVERDNEVLRLGNAPVEKQIWDQEYIFWICIVPFLALEIPLNYNGITDMQITNYGWTAIIYAGVFSAVIALCCHYAGELLNKPFQRMAAWLTIVGGLGCTMTTIAIRMAGEGTAEYQLVLAILGLTFYGLGILVSWRVHLHRTYWKAMERIATLSAQIDKMKEDAARETTLIKSARDEYDAQAESVGTEALKAAKGQLKTAKQRQSELNTEKQRITSRWAFKITEGINRIGEAFDRGRRYNNK